jgi:hypothetical protein
MTLFPILPAIDAVVVVILRSKKNKAKPYGTVSTVLNRKNIQTSNFKLEEPRKNIFFTRLMGAQVNSKIFLVKGHLTEKVIINNAHYAHIFCES